MPVDLEIRTYIEQHPSSVRVHAVLPSPLVTQNRSTRSDIYRAGMYEEPSPARKGGQRATGRPQGEPSSSH